MQLIYPAFLFATCYLSQAFTAAHNVLGTSSDALPAFKTTSSWCLEFIWRSRRVAANLAQASALERGLADANEALQKARHELVEAILVHKVLTEDATAAVQDIVTGVKCLRIIKTANGVEETLVVYDPVELDPRGQSTPPLPPPIPPNLKCMGFSMRTKARCSHPANRTFRVDSTQYPANGAANCKPPSCMCAGTTEGSTAT